MELLEVATRARDGAAEVVGLVRRASEPIELSFRFPEAFQEFLAPDPEAFVCALLVPAMSLGTPLRSRLPVSAQLLRGLRRAQEALRQMYPRFLSTVPVEAETRSQAVPRESRRMATFFSGGVDSFYTALSNLEDPKPGDPPLTHAVFMRGLETELEVHEGVEESAALARQAAEALGLQFVEGESNMRSFFSIEWGAWSGTGLAATALALGRGFGVFLIPAGSRYWHVAPPRIGSHPLIDESCSTEWLRIRNDGAHVGRPYKIATLVGRSEVAMAYLRLCTVNRGAAYNCGRCAKCLRTMVAMEAAGVLERARTLPTQLPPNWHRGYRPASAVVLRECVAIARERNRPQPFLGDLERVLRRVRRRNALREFLEASWLSPMLPAIRRIRAALRRNTQ